MTHRCNARCCWTDRHAEATQPVCSQVSYKLSPCKKPIPMQGQEPWYMRLHMWIRPRQKVSTELMGNEPCLCCVDSRLLIHVRATYDRLIPRVHLMHIHSLHMTHSTFLCRFLISFKHASYMSLVADTFCHATTWCKTKSFLPGVQRTLCMALWCRSWWRCRGPPRPAACR